MKAFYRGLDSLKFGDLMKDFPSLTQSLFVAKFSPITASMFLTLVSSVRPVDETQKKAYDYFMEFITGK